MAARYPFGNEHLTVKQISERTGLCESTLRTRIMNGLPLDRGYGVIPLRQWYEGEYLTVKQIAERAGLSVKAVQDRIKRGKPLEDPRYHNRRRDLRKMIDYPLAEFRELMERRYLLRLMAHTNGNASEAARLAQHDRSAFKRLLEKHDIPRRRANHGKWDAPLPEFKQWSPTPEAHTKS